MSVPTTSVSVDMGPSSSPLELKLEEMEMKIDGLYTLRDNVTSGQIERAANRYGPHQNSKSFKRALSKDPRNRRVVPVMLKGNKL